MGLGDEQAGYMPDFILGLLRNEVGPAPGPGIAAAHKVYYSYNETIGRADKRRIILTDARRPYRGAAKAGNP
jgi:hypothetical protein